MCVLVSIITTGIIIWLVYSELSYYWQSRFEFKFAPDTDYEAKLKINIDLTVAMPCHSKYSTTQYTLLIAFSFLNTSLTTYLNTFCSSNSIYTIYLSHCI